jgi:exopolysaccharide biosynthesis polyprenyl glycosylphosphotransferase
MKHAYAEGSPTYLQDETPAVGEPIVAAPLRRQRIFEGRIWTGLCVAVDLIALSLGNLAALVGAPDQIHDGQALIWLLPAFTCALLAFRGMYKDAIQQRIVDGLGKVVAATSLAAISVIAVAALLEPSAEPGPLIARAWVFGTIYVAGARVLLNWQHKTARTNRLVARPTLIVGAGQIGARVEKRLLRQPQLGLLPVGYLDADPPPDEMVPDRQAPVLGSPSDLARAAKETGARHVVLGFSTAPDRLLIPLVRECETLGLQVSIVPRLFESVNVRVALDHLGGLPLFGLHTIDPKGWQFAVKHILDRAAAGIGLIVLAPLLLVLTIAVKLSSRGPILFRQWRTGRDGRDFEILKFRSMGDEPSPAKPSDSRNVVALPSDLGPGDTGPGGVEGVDRRTRVGRFMRRTSLDELPQLINVLRGEMSLVGPRPERPEFVDLFGSRIEHYDDRHRVKSGITGWAQVNGLRGKTSLSDRVEWDNYYITNWSLTFDFKILVMTVASLFQRAE